MVRDPIRPLKAVGRGPRIDQCELGAESQVVPRPYGFLDGVDGGTANLDEPDELVRLPDRLGDPEQPGHLAAGREVLTEDLRLRGQLVQGGCSVVDGDLEAA